MIEDLLLQPDGKIVVSGGFSHIIDGTVNPPARRGIARFSANGLLDNTFTPSLTPPAGANTIVLAAMARQPNGKILIEQNFLNDDIFFSTQIARLNSNGSLDTSFTLGNPAGGGYWLSEPVIASCACPAARPSSAEISALTTAPPPGRWSGSSPARRILVQALYSSCWATSASWA